MRSLLLTFAVAAFAVASMAGAVSSGEASPAQKPAPYGLIGLAPQTTITTEDLSLMRQARVHRLRLVVPWFDVHPVPPWRRKADWRGFDHVMELTARARFEVLPFIWGSPSWAASDPTVEPVSSRKARRGWTALLRGAARRYGPGGAFWRQNPDLPRMPVRVWQLWNEPNIVSFSRRPDPKRWARLMKLSARALRSVNPGAKVLASGLFGKPLHKPNIPSAEFLRRALQGTGLRQVIDGIALHPYVPRARGIPRLVEDLRTVLREFDRPRMPLWITEMGWGSDSGESRWERGWRGQARELNVAMRHLTQSRRRWRLKRIYWYSWIDAPVCQFCDSSGLFTDDGRAKPSWYAFNSWTGGDPRLPEPPDPGPGVLPGLPLDGP